MRNKEELIALLFEDMVKLMRKIITYRLIGA